MSENAANTECKILLMYFTDPHHGAHSVMFQVSVDRLTDTNWQNTL